MAQSVEKIDLVATEETSVPTQFSTPRYIAWMYNLDSFGVEDRGIERVLPGDRLDGTWSQYITVLGLWFAGCGGLTTMSSFFLPTLLFGLNMKQALVSGLIGMNIGCFVPAYCLTMGPKSGCRQMVTARFIFGQWGVKFVAIICILGGIGWSVVNCVVGGQILSAISNVGLEVGIIVISLGSLVIGVFGIRVLLKFQTAVAIPTNVAILLLYIVVCKKTKYISEANELVKELQHSSQTTTGLWLSFFTLAYSVTATWGSCASDYYILFPDTTPDHKVFLLTYLGIAIPSNFAAVVGLLAGTISYAYTPWNEAYNTYGIGGVIAAAFQSWGKFGKFVVVVLFLSLMCNTIINTYSAAFEFQLIDRRMMYVPRWIWATFISVAYLVISLAGKEHLSTIISNVLALLGYWISMYITILLEENIFFRRRSTAALHYKEFEDSDATLYNWSQWDQPKKITLGLASSASFAIGVVGAVMGMNQVYYIGPISKLIGDYGGDVGMWLCMGFSGVTYPVFRMLELKKFGR
ncbi:CIC11C00000001971 [Sungouiella intermedia]|uniref:CIC11C00000001971 n=1 Tax=Sungouiella intermedia TaxID=45354 RepID=A0A1L0D7L2_9ASCO|nr:CIC11C00000001971 [[Candida] intermedia]